MVKRHSTPYVTTLRICVCVCWFTCEPTSGPTMTAMKMLLEIVHNVIRIRKSSLVAGRWNG